MTNKKQTIIGGRTLHDLILNGSYQNLKDDGNYNRNFECAIATYMNRKDCFKSRRMGKVDLIKYVNGVRVKFEIKSNGGYYLAEDFNIKEEFTIYCPDIMSCYSFDDIYVIPTEDLRFLFENKLMQYKFSSKKCDRMEDEKPDRLYYRHDKSALKKFGDFLPSYFQTLQQFIEDNNIANCKD